MEFVDTPFPERIAFQAKAEPAWQTELTALLSGSQVSQPQYANSNMPTIPTTDSAGLINNAYNQKLQAWQQNNANSQGLLGGLFSLGASFI